MPTTLDRVEAAERMQKHIEAHLGDKITMSELARAAGYSQWHAARVFKEVTGKSPFEYIRLRRLSAAAEALQQTSRKVIDVAFDFVFDSHEGFTRAFARQFGVSPQRLRRGGAAIELFMPPQIRSWYTTRQRGGAPMADAPRSTPNPNPNPTAKPRPETVFVQVLDRPDRRMIVKRGRQATHYFEYCEEVGCEVWDQLAALPNTLQEPIGMWLPARFRLPGTSQYVQGVEIAADFGGAVPEGFEILELPACKMMVFQGPPFEDHDFEQAIASLWDVMKNYRPETTGYAWADDDGPRFQLRPEGYRGYIEGRPVRAV